MMEYLIGKDEEVYKNARTYKTGFGFFPLAEI